MSVSSTSSLQSSYKALSRPGRVTRVLQRMPTDTSVVSSHEGVPPLRGQGEISNAELAGRPVEIVRSAEALNPWNGEQWWNSANALINDVSEFLSGGGSFSPDQSAQLIGPMVALFQQCLGYQSSPDAVALALRALDTVFLLCKKYDFAPDVQWMLDAIALLLREGTDPVLAASVLEHFAECVPSLPPDTPDASLAGVIEPMGALFQRYSGDWSSPGAAVLALRTLDTFFLLYNRSGHCPDVQWILDAIALLLREDTDPVLAASVLEHFAECIQFLPPSTPDASLAKVIEPMGAFFRRYSGDWSSPDAVAPALRTLGAALLLLGRTGQGTPQFIPDALNEVAQSKLEKLDFENKVTLIRMLVKFSEVIQIWKLSDEARGVFAELAIEVMCADNNLVDLVLKAEAFRVFHDFTFAQRNEPNDDVAAAFKALYEAIGDIDLNNKERCPALATMLGDFAECVPSLPQDALAGVIEQVQDLFSRALVPLNTDIVTAAFRVLCAFTRREDVQNSAGHVLGALQEAIERMVGNRRVRRALATMLRDFAECVPFLPEGDALAGVIEQVKGLFNTALKWRNPDIVTAAFRVLCAFAQKDPDSAEPVLGALEKAIREMGGGNEVALRALATMLGDFAEYVPFLLPELEDLVGVIEQVKELFNTALERRNPNIVLVSAAFRVLCAFARKDPSFAGSVLEALQGAIRRMTAGNRRVRPALATMLRDFAELVPFLPLEEEDLEGVIEPVKGLFNAALKWRNPDIALVTAPFRVLCAFVQSFSQREKLNIAMQVFSQALGMLKGQAGELGGKLAAINDRPKGGEAKLEAYDEAMQLFEGCASTLAGCIGQVPAEPAELRNRFIGQIKGEFDAAYGQMQAGRDDKQRFVGMKVAHELLKFWGLLLVPPGSIYAVLDAVVTALNQNGRHYFSCRGDAEWRRIHTSNPGVYGILARTDLALITGKVVELTEMTAGTVMALGTVLRRASAGVGARTCDAYTQVLCCALGEMRGVTARVIAEMQQKLRMTGGRDNLMERIEEYIALARKKLREEGLEAEEGAQVFGIGYQGYGKRGTLERRGNAATLAIGAPIALEGKPLTPEELLALVERFRDAIVRSLAPAEPPMATRSCKMGRPRIDDAVIDVITVIGTSHILTPAIIENLRLHQDARALCNFLQITKESMIKRLDENDKQASLMLGEGVVKSPEVTGDRKFAEASRAFKGDVVRMNGGLLIENCQLSRKARLAERKNCQLKNRNCRLENRLATAEEQRDAAEARLAKERKACLAADARAAKEKKACRAATARLAKEKARAARRGKRFEELAALQKEDKEIEEKLNRLDPSGAESAQLTGRRAEIQREIARLEQEAKGSPPPSAPFVPPLSPGRLTASPPRSSKSRPQPGTPETPPKRPRPPVSGTSSTARALRSGETLLTLATFLTDCNRRDQDMWGDGWCGFYAILSQMEPDDFAEGILTVPEGGFQGRPFGGAALATWNGAQGAQAAVMVLQQALRYRPWDQLDTERLQRVAQHTRRAVVLMDTMGSQGGYDVKQIDLAIPISAKEAVVLTVASLDTLGLPFLTWLMSFLTGAGRERDAATVVAALGRYLPADVDNFTVLDVIRGLLRNPQTIGLSHPTANHFHALQPQGAGAWPEDQLAERDEQLAAAEARADTAEAKLAAAEARADEEREARLAATARLAELEKKVLKLENPAPPPSDGNDFLA